MLSVLVRGTGDIGSAVAHSLFQAGYAVVIHDVSQPSSTRRGMAFTDAVFDGQATLAGIGAVRLGDTADIRDALAVRMAVLITVTDFYELLTLAAPDILVDARMRLFTGCLEDEVRVSVRLAGNRLRGRPPGTALPPVARAA